MGKGIVTKMRIAEALKELAETDDIDHITITDICQKIGLQRQTFYYHFKTKNDLIFWICKHDLIDAVVTDVNPKYWPDMIVDVMDRIEDQGEFMVKLANSSVNYLGDEISEQLVDTFLDELRKYVGGHRIFDKSEIMFVRFCAFGIVYSIINWIRRGMSDNRDAVKTLVGDVTQIMCYKLRILTDF